MTRVSIHSLELTPLECEVLSELMAAKLDQHLADRAKYMRPAAKSGTGASGSGATADAGSPLPAKPALLLQPRLYGKATWPAKAPALVAWDLTLRCPVCGSNVEGRRDDYHCFTCERTTK